MKVEIVEADNHLKLSRQVNDFINDESIEVVGVTGYCHYSRDPSYFRETVEGHYAIILYRIK